MDVTTGPDAYFLAIWSLDRFTISSVALPLSFTGLEGFPRVRFLAVAGQTRIGRERQ